MGFGVRGIVVAASLALLASCGSSSQPGAPGSGTARTSTSPAPLVSAAPGSRAAIRDNTARGPYTDGIALETRALVSKVTGDDGLPFAFRFVRESTPSGPDPWDTTQVDESAVVSSLHFDIELPGGGKQSLDVAPDGAAKPDPIAVTWLRPTVTLERGGLAIGKVKRAWKAPVDGLFAAPGTYVLTTTATFETKDKSIVLASGKLTFEIAPPSDAFKRLVDLERAASEVARSTWSEKSIPIPRDPTVDDVDGNVSVRFERPESQGGRTGYDDELLEVWLDRSGKTLVADGYVHFTCVAEGTHIATPDGDVPVETLAIGAEVLAYDVDTHRRSLATVIRMDRGTGGALVAFGDLLVTREHPLWVTSPEGGGAWKRAGDVAAGTTLLGASLERLAATPIEVGGAHVVYDLGVTAPHTYFAGGVLVHNKAVGVPLGGASRPWGPLFFRHAAR